MAYEKNTWASGDVVTSAKLNHMENGIEAASSPYDLVIVAEAEDGDVASVPISDYHITYGSIEACEQKIANMEPVNVFLGVYQAYDADTPNILGSWYLSGFDAYYREIKWNNSEIIITYTSNYEFNAIIWD